MDIKKIIKNTESILEQIKYHNNLYYNLDKPEISDAKYDELISNLKDLKNKHPDILKNLDLLDKIGGEALAQFTKFTHPSRMLSLDNAMNSSDLDNFEKKVQNFLGNKDLKLD